MTERFIDLDVNLPDGATQDDIVDIALREAIRQGKIVRSKDDEGRNVYKAVPVN